MGNKKSIYLEVGGLYRIGKYTKLKSTKVVFSGTQVECEEYIEEKVNPEEEELTKILFICTSNKDRSPALEKYFNEAYEGFECKSAGINQYFCGKKGTHYVTFEDLLWANFVVYAEDIHKRRTKEIIEPNVVSRPSIVLKCGEYKQGCVGDDYIMIAEEKILKVINKEFKI